MKTYKNFSQQDMANLVGAYLRGQGFVVPGPCEWQSKVTYRPGHVEDVETVLRVEVEGGPES